MTDREKIEYVAGFIDGDGSIYSYLNKGYVSVFLSCGSTHRPTLEFIQAISGGTIHAAPVRDSAWKPQFHLVPSAAKFLPVVAPYLFLRSTQAELALKLFSLRTKNRGCAGMPAAERLEQQKLMDQIKSENARHSCAHSGRLLSDAYIAGFFDAEGSVSVRKRPEANSYSVSCRFANNQRCVLDAISTVVGGVVREYVRGQFSLGIYGRAVDSFIERMSPFSITKGERLSVAYQVRSLRCQNGQRHSFGNFEKLGALALEMQILNRKGQVA